MNLISFLSGDTYQSGVAYQEADIDTIPAALDSEDKEHVFFDLETTGLGSYLFGYFLLIVKPQQYLDFLSSR